MSQRELEKVQLLLNKGVALEQVAKEMGFRSYHTFRVRMLEEGATIQQCVVDVKTRRPLQLPEAPLSATCLDDAS